MAEQIESSQKAFVIATIQRFFPEVQILAFGSRINGKPQRYSDLDIALKGFGRLERGSLSDLKDTFAHSQIPFKIDVLDFHAVTADFQKIIERTCVKWA